MTLESLIKKEELQPLSKNSLSNTTQKLIILRAPPGYGKSTLARSLAERHNLSHYEADQYFMNADGSYKYKVDRVPDAHESCYAKVKNALTQGKSVVVSNTFIKRWELNRYIELARTLKIPYDIVHLTSKYTNKHGVSDDKVSQLEKGYQPHEEDISLENYQALYPELFS